MAPLFTWNFRLIAWTCQ